jgi:hypothetical protein
MHIPLSAVSEKDLLALVENKVAEAKSIEYKEALPGNSDGDKKEFLADVTSFANASGGDIIFGIREEEGVPVEVCGLEQQNIDQEIARLENLMRDGISPRIVGKDIKPVELQNGAVVMILRVPRSWALPHMVTYQKHFRFYTRNTNGKHPMDVSEIRAAVTLSETMLEKIRSFRLTRLSMIGAGEAPLQTTDKPTFVLHLVPLNAFDPSTQIDLRAAENNVNLISPVYIGTGETRYNADGFLAYRPMYEGEVIAYTQVFRNGIIESADALIFSDEEKLIPSLDFEKDLFEALRRYFIFLNMAGISSSLVIMISMLGVRGLTMGVQTIGARMRERKVIDRNDLFIPEGLIENLNVDITEALKPILDAIWNAAGYRGSIYYRDGKWVGRG